MDMEARIRMRSLVMADRAKRLEEVREQARLIAKPYEDHVAEATRPPVTVWEDALRRNSAKMSTTASICGDPRPGQSALDHMQARMQAGQ